MWQIELHVYQANNKVRLSELPQKDKSSEQKTIHRDNNI